MNAAIAVLIGGEVSVRVHTLVVDRVLVSRLLFLLLINYSPIREWKL